MYIVVANARRQHCRIAAIYKERKKRKKKKRLTPNIAIGKSLFQILISLSFHIASQHTKQSERTAFSVYSCIYNTVGGKSHSSLKNITLKRANLYNTKYCCALILKVCVCNNNSLYCLVSARFRWI